MDTNMRGGSDNQDLDLLRTARLGHLEEVEFLVGRGADMDTRDNYGRTPLSNAVEYKNLKTVEFLKKTIKQRQADVDNFTKSAARR